MKKYTQQSVLRLPLATARTKQAPFPGRFPVRLLIFFAGRAPYIGKPPAIDFYQRNPWRNAIRFVEFDRRHRGRGVRATAVHPGGIQTELTRHIDLKEIEDRINQINKQLASEGQGPFQWKTVPQGAATSVWAGVVAPGDEVGGKYCENCHVGKAMADNAEITMISEGVRGYALDAKNAEALWKKSEELVGETF